MSSATFRTGSADGGDAVLAEIVSVEVTGAVVGADAAGTSSLEQPATTSSKLRVAANRGFIRDTLFQIR